MEQRDYFKKQIDQLGRVLGKILADLVGLKDQGQISEYVEITNQKLKEETGLDLKHLMGDDTDSFAGALEINHKFSKENLDKLADIFLLLADGVHNSSENYEKGKSFYTRALEIFEYLEKTDTVYSLDRRFKIERIKKRLNNNDLN